MPQSVYTQSTTNINQHYPVESHTIISNQTLNKTKDWFYGTEELLDALPKAWTRSMLYLLVSFAAIILPWAMFTKVDETGSIARQEQCQEQASLQQDHRAYK